LELQVLFILPFLLRNVGVVADIQGNLVQAGVLQLFIIKLLQDVSKVEVLVEDELLGDLHLHLLSAKLIAGLPFGKVGAFNFIPQFFSVIIGSVSAIPLLDGLIVEIVEFEELSHLLVARVDESPQLLVVPRVLEDRFYVGHFHSVVQSVNSVGAVHADEHSLIH